MVVSLDEWEAMRKGGWNYKKKENLNIIKCYKMSVLTLDQFNHIV